MNVYDVFCTISRSINKRIDSDDFFDKYRIGKAFSRSRKLSFHNIISFIFNSTHKSLAANYADLRDVIPMKKLPVVSKQALSKARLGISADAFRDLFLLSVKEYYQSYKFFNLWNGYHIYAVDGSTIQIPESKENLEHFGFNPNKNARDTPLASVSVLYDVMNDILVDATINPYRYNERTSAIEHMNHLPNSKNAIVLFDRGYPSEALFRLLHQQGVFFLMRVPSTFKKAISSETDTLFSYPAKKSEGVLTLRTITFTLENGTVERLVTNLMSSNLNVTQFGHLYALRWGIESKYRELKNRWEIENFNCMKSISIVQEFYAAMLLSNLSSLIKSEADSIIERDSPSTNKHKYQANRSFILNRIKTLIIRILSAKSAQIKKIISSLIEEASNVKSIIRPGRKYGRFRRNTRRRYYMHMKSCT